MDAFRVDAHVKVLDESVVERAKACDLDAIVYAPHFTRLSTIQERAEQYSDDSLLVIPAREVFTGDWRNRKHVLAMGLTEPVPDFITLEGAMAEFDRQGATVLAPHPEFATVSLEAHDIRAHANRIHGIEVYNAKNWPSHVERARQLADEFSIPAVGSSYAHLSWTVGAGWTGFANTYDSVADIIDAFREGHPRRVYRQQGFTHNLRCAIEFSHLLYENSWKKFDRIFLSGTDPTHPSHIAYQGRFDAVSVYSDDEP